jgi:hypothetical protein
MLPRHWSFNKILANLARLYVHSLCKKLNKYKLQDSYVTGTNDLRWSILRIYFVRRIRCTPESVHTGPLILPTSSPKAASSNGFCICPRANDPRSPPRLAELQSLNSDASSWNVFLPLLICSSNSGISHTRFRILITTPMVHNNDNMMVEQY